jgi:hypothetical protein
MNLSEAGLLGASERKLVVAAHPFFQDDEPALPEDGGVTGEGQASVDLPSSLGEQDGALTERKQVAVLDDFHVLVAP